MNISSAKFFAESQYYFYWNSRRKPVLFLLKFSQKVNIVSVKFPAERWCTFCQLCRRKSIYILLNFFRKWVLFPLIFSQKMNISSAKFLAESRYFCKKPVCKNIDFLRKKFWLSAKFLAPPTPKTNREPWLADIFHYLKPSNIMYAAYT